MAEALASSSNPPGSPTSGRRPSSSKSRPRNGGPGPAEWRMQKGTKIKGLARRKGDLDPRHWGFSIQDELSQHPMWIAELPRRKPKEKKEKKKEKPRKEIGEREREREKSYGKKGMGMLGMLMFLGKQVGKKVVKKEAKIEGEVVVVEKAPESVAA